jgi:hypothetical protein
MRPQWLSILQDRSTRRHLGHAESHVICCPDPHWQQGEHQEEGEGPHR